MIAVDVGGTFTDVVALRDGRIEVAKVATRSHEPHAGVLEGARRIGVADAAVFNHASTHGLNSIITRRLPKIGFLTTRGHRDMLDHGRLVRPREAVTDPRWRRAFSDSAQPLVPRYLRRAVVERRRHDGAVVVALDREQAAAEIDVLGRCGVEGVAICLLNAYADGKHERQLRELVRERLGDGVAVSVSSEVSPLAKEYARAATTVVDVMMKLIYDDYTERLRGGLAELGFPGRLNYADSAATLISADFAMQQPFRIVFAGPAAGTAASTGLGAVIGVPDVLCADVGGTSCDISVVTGGEAYRNVAFEIEHDLVVNSLTTDISTLGAGGGSVVAVNALGEICVGPDSAGAVPGPACYDAGGDRPTTTDACLLMGLIDPDTFADGQVKLSPDRAREAFERLDTPLDLAARVRAAWEIGLHNVEEGIFTIALKHGVDPRDYTLFAYGAAGPMILPSLLGRMGLRGVVVPPHPGLFSALGLLSTDMVYSESRSAYRLLSPDSAAGIEAAFAEMEAALLDRIGGGDAGRRVTRTFDGCLYGQSWETPFVPVAGRVDAGSTPGLVAAFHEEYRRRNGNAFPDIPVEVVTPRVQVEVPSQKIEFPRLAARTDGAPSPIGHTVLRHLTDDEVPAPIFARADLRHGDVVAGPAVVREPMSTTFVPAGRTCEVGVVGELRIA